ncbi:MAG: NFACT family protein, partial [Ruthenibacterium sp.]
MALDAATIALAAKELSARLADAKIDKIFEPTRDEVVLNLRLRGGAGANPHLFVSARSGSARVCLTQESFENPAVPPSFCMLLRKHFTGGRLLSVRTLPDERIVFFDFQCTSEMGDTVQNTLAVELMGRYSNLVLVQGGKIIDALKRVDFEDSEVRQLLPGL